jgi:asparagine synthase (glutamine-hydrolysing)
VCGIAGYTKLDHPIEAGRIDRLIESIRHRGPDQQGSHDGELCALGTARLAILDISQGNQPMYANGGDVVIAFNGEIYNHDELRESLEQLGHQFHTRCDTEAVLRGFVEWDTQVFDHLRGMFAVAIWCTSKRRLIVARDRMGIKPLYIYHRGRDLYFGSELKCILGHPEVPRKLDLNGLSYYLSLNWIPAPHTLIEGLEKINPGEFLEWNNGQIYRERYFNMRYEVDRSLTFEDAKEELDRLLRASVRDHLISDVPLGVWASGGLDSSTVLHYAAQEVPKLNTFSISFRGHSHDESRYFQEVAQQYGTQHHEFDLRPDEDLEGAIREMAYYSDEPSADAGALPVWFLSKMTRQYVTVALSGEGADELFGGYQTYLADRLAERVRDYPMSLRKAALAVARLWPASDEKISFEFKVKRFLEGSMLPPADAHLFWNGGLNDVDKRSLYPASRYPRPGELMNTLPTEAHSASGLNRFMFLDQRYYLADDILYKCDRMSMAHSLEVRPPFLDHRIVQFAATLPEDFKIHGDSLKFVLRDLMRGKLPPSILARPKEGFDIPAHRWFRGALRGLMEDTLSPEAVRSTGLFRVEAVESIKRAHLKRRANYGYPLWALVTLFLWMKRWNVETAASA